MSTIPSWKMKALADPNLPEKDWVLLNLGPSTLAQAFRLQVLKLKYIKD